MQALHELVRELNAAGVRHLLVGIVGANHWARDAGTIGTLREREILLAPEAEGLRLTWRRLRALGYTLREGRARLPDALSAGLAAEVIARGAPTTGYRLSDRFLVQLATTMPGPSFETLWAEHRRFRAEGVELHVPRLRHILEGLMARETGLDRLVVLTWAQALHDMRTEAPFARQLMAAARADREAQTLACFSGPPPRPPIQAP